jgi:hypothetical protein
VRRREYGARPYEVGFFIEQSSCFDDMQGWR